MEDILNIKKMIPIVKEFSYDKDALYIDQIIRYITNDYPLWIKRDMEKLPSEDEMSDEGMVIKRTYNAERKIKIKGRKTETITDLPF